jgi:hypothetical protein
MNFTVNAVFSLSIAIAAIIGWARFKRTDPAFLPFLILLWTGLSNEIFSLVIMYKGFTNVYNYNLYTLAEALLITWQFERWKLFAGKKWLYYLLQFAYPAGWLAELLLTDRQHLFTSYFIIGHAILIVLMSVSMNNKLLFKITHSLFKEPVFLICAGFTLYFVYALLVEAFWMYGLNQSRFFRLRIYEILAYVNLITNLIFAFATLWMPLKRQYILQS